MILRKRSEKLVSHPQGVGGVLRISSDGDDRRIFWGLKFSVRGGALRDDT